MATPTVRTVAVELDRTRNLRLDMNALCRAEDLTGRNFLESSAWRDLSLRHVRALLYACLVHEDPTLTLEQVGESLHLGNLGEMIEKLMSLYRTEGQPEAAEEEGEKEGEEAAPLGVKVSAAIS